MKIINILDILKQEEIKISKDGHGVDFVFGEYILYSSDRDLLVGKVVSGDRSAPNGIKIKDVKVKKVLTKNEIDEYMDTQKGERDRIKIIQKIADKFKLPMRFFSSKISWKKNITSFLFTSEQQIDFREMLKLVSKEFNTRIHLQRCSKHERVKIIGGVGPCGRSESCCHFTGFGQNKKISMNAVRDQGIQINGNNHIFGLSGSIKKCMTYELDFYHERNKYMPHIRQEVKYNDQKGKVINIDIPSNKVKILLDNKTISVVDIQEITYKNQVPFKPEPEIKLKTDIELDGVTF